MREDHEQKTTRAVDERVRQQETEARRLTLESNSMLQQYRARKTDTFLETIYDNGVGGSLFEARAGAPRTPTYHGHFDTTVELTLCSACGKLAEDVENIVR